MCHMRIDENMFSIGEHLIVERTCFTHHGIYAGSGLVIENRLELGIVYMPLAAFADGAEVRVRKHPYAKFNGLQALERAQSRLGEKSYNLVTFNCEHFVNWCIEGVETSRQVDNSLAMLEPFRAITDNLPILGELTKEARQKAIAGHLATNPDDHETSAHFDKDTQIRQFKEDITGSNEQLSTGVETIFNFAQKFRKQVCDIEQYLDTVQADQEASQVRSLDDLFTTVQRRYSEQASPKSKSRGREVAITPVYQAQEHALPKSSYDVVLHSAKRYPKGQSAQSSYSQTSQQDLSPIVEIFKRNQP